MYESINFILTLTVPPTTSMSQQVIYNQFNKPVSSNELYTCTHTHMQKYVMNIIMMMQYHYIIIHS